MEKQLKMEAQKTISSTTGHQKEGGGGDVATSGGGGTGNSSINITPKKRKLEGSSEAETIYAETSSKKRNGSPPTEVRTINLKAGQDVVDAIYQLSKAYDHRRSLNIISATGLISDIVFRDQYGYFKGLKVSYMTSLYVSRLVHEDGHHCPEKATCSISFCDQNGLNFESVDMGHLIAAGPIEIIADTSKELKKEKKKLAGKSSYAAAAAVRNGNSDQKIHKNELLFTNNSPNGRWKHTSHNNNFWREHMKLSV